jgi:hypothetical protein
VSIKKGAALFEGAPFSSDARERRYFFEAGFFFAGFFVVFAFTSLVALSIFFSREHSHFKGPVCAASNST